MRNHQSQQINITIKKKEIPSSNKQRWPRPSQERWRVHASKNHTSLLFPHLQIMEIPSMTRRG
jgi:hypothetical protein